MQKEYTGARAWSDDGEGSKDVVGAEVVRVRSRRAATSLPGRRHFAVTDQARQLNSVHVAAIPEKVIAFLCLASPTELSSVNPEDFLLAVRTRPMATPSLLVTLHNTVRVIFSILLPHIT